MAMHIGAPAHGLDQIPVPFPGQWTEGKDLPFLCLSVLSVNWDNESPDLVGQVRVFGERMPLPSPGRRTWQPGLLGTGVPRGLRGVGRETPGLT